MKQDIPVEAAAQWLFEALEEACRGGINYIDRSSSRGHRSVIIDGEFDLVKVMAHVLRRASQEES